MRTVHGTTALKRAVVGVMIALCLALSPAAADQVVYFVNGKAMMVRAVEKGGKFTVLEIEGGGRIGVPTEQILKIEEYVISPPTAFAQPVIVQPSVAQASAVTPPSPMQAGVPSGGPPVPSPALGPGLGGRASMAEGRGLGGLTPLSVGEPAGGPQHAVPRPGAGPNLGVGPQRAGAGGAFGRGGRGGIARPGMGRPRPPLAAQAVAPAPGVPQATQFQYADPADPGADTSEQAADAPNPGEEEEQPQEPASPPDPEAGNPRDFPPQS